MKDIKKIIESFEWPYNEIYGLVGEQHIPVIVAKVYTLSDGQIILYTKVTGNGAEAVFGYNVQELELEKPLRFSISRLIRRDVKTLISLEDLNRFDESYPEFKLKKFYLALNTDANILIPLYCEQDPMIRQFMECGLYIFANEWFKNDFFLSYRENYKENVDHLDIEQMFRLPIDILRRIDKSVLKIEKGLETISYIFSIHPEWAESVEMINEQVFWSWVEQLPSLLEISPNILQISRAIEFHLIRKQRQKQRHVYRVNGVNLTYYFDDETLN